MRRKVAYVALAVLLAVAVAVVVRLATTSTLGLMLVGDKAPSSWVVDNLSSSDPDLVMTSLNILEERRNSDGQEKARELLDSTDDYIWLNAATYLAAIQDQTSVPWLIKALKHPAWRSVDERVKYLEALTNQQFGRNQEAWIDWWKKEHPDSTFNFRYKNLENEAARLTGGTSLLINGVVDALTINHVGPTIRLIGIRPKNGLDDQKAIHLLKTLVMDQYVQLRFDSGPLLDDNGSRRAFVY